MRPCCQLCFGDVIVDEAGNAAWCCNDCALRLAAVADAARNYDEHMCGYLQPLESLEGRLCAAIRVLDAAKKERG